MTTYQTSPPWHAWAPDITIGLCVLFAGLLEIARLGLLDEGRASNVAVVIGFAAAAGLSRRAPGSALALVWTTCSLQLLTNTPVLLTELAIVVVAFGTARWGSRLTVWLSALSIPLAVIVVLVFATPDIFRLFLDNGHPRRLLDGVGGTNSPAGTMLLGVAVLVAPWLAGLALRFMAKARRSEISEVAAQVDAARALHEATQSHEIAILRDQQARLARDVHDVVGHSLAVILAQAESAQYLADNPEKLKETMATIATSARSSLQDVRQVLAPVDAPVRPRPGGFEALIEGVRASGHEVVAQEIGTPQPLPPELDVVAYRVLQEMLTNAIKHGRRDRPVLIERHWPDGVFDQDLRIEVRNVEVAADLVDAQTTQPVGGQGLEGMRRRLDAVGGRIDVRRREYPQNPGSTTFTVTAWVPVRTRSA